MSFVTNQRLISDNHFVSRSFAIAPHREVGGINHRLDLSTRKVNKVQEIKTKKQNKTEGQFETKQNDSVLNNLGFPVLVPDFKNSKNVHPVIKTF